MTTTTRRLFALVAVSVLALAACGDDDDDDAEAEAGAGSSTSTTTVTTAPDKPADAGAVVMLATLSGEEEVPGPGVADGTGTAEVRFADDQLCYDLKVTMGEKPTLTHIHQGAKGEAGPVVVDLKPSFAPGETAFLAEGCVTPEAAKVNPIISDPSAFYVNVHSAEHPNGALRGQLTPKPASS